MLALRNTQPPLTHQHSSLGAYNRAGIFKLESSMRKALVPTLAWMLGCASATVGGEHQNYQGDNPLRVCISVPRGEQYTCNVIPVTVKLVNVSGRPVGLTSVFRHRDGLKLYCLKPGKEKYVRASSGRMIIHRPVGWNYDKVLQPDGGIQVTEFISLGRLIGEVKYAPPGPGTGKIKAVYRYGDTFIESNVATVTFKAASGLDKKVRTLFDCERWHRFVMSEGRTEDEKGLKPFRDFLYSGQHAPQRTLLAYLVGRNDVQDDPTFIAFGMAWPTASKWLRSKMTLLMAKQRLRSIDWKGALKTLSSFDAASSDTEMKKESERLQAKCEEYRALGLKREQE